MIAHTVLERVGVWWKTPESGVDRVLFEAAWENERAINSFRIFYCLFMGIPSVLAGLIQHGTLSTAVGFLLYALVGFGVRSWLKRSFHRAAAFALSTADATFYVCGLYLGSLEVMPFDTVQGTAMFNALHLNAMFVLGMNAARFSVAVTVWTGVYAYLLYAGLVVYHQGFRQALVFEAIFFASFTLLLAMTVHRIRASMLRARERDAFARFLSTAAVERLTRDPGQLNLRGEAQDVTVIFSDIRGFTQMSSKMAPEEVVVMLNEYFAEMVEELFKWEGTLDKFIGDGLVAVFGPPLSQQEQARRAIACSLGMLARLEVLNDRRRGRGQPPLAIGIGIHSGPLVAGSIGSSARMEYTHIGDTMNTCSRIEGLTKELGAAILASDATVQRAGRDGTYEARVMPDVKVKGKDEPLQVYAIEAPGMERP